MQVFRYSGGNEAGRDFVLIDAALVHWELGAFAPLTAEELAEFDGAPVFPRVDPA
jgi:hypothetical protein